MEGKRLGGGENSFLKAFVAMIIYCISISLHILEKIFTTHNSIVVSMGTSLDNSVGIKQKTIATFVTCCKSQKRFRPRFFYHLFP